MNNQDLLSEIVSLYRESYHSSIDDSSSECKLTLNNSLISKINNINENDEIISRLKCAGKTISLPLGNDKEGTEIHFTLDFPVMKFRRFFKNLEDLIDHQTGIKKGKIPDAFYLLEEDYLSGEQNQPEKYQQLEQVCRWILFLKKALPHTEEKGDSYVFVLLTEDKEKKSFKKHLIESRFEYKELCNLSGLDKFEDILTSDDLHTSERLAVIRNALEELFANQPSEHQRLGFTLSKFDVLKQLYQDNYETYINGFSLKDFKKEVIEKHNEFASQIESNLNDITNKAFIIPVSIASIGALIKTNNIENAIIVSIGVLLVSMFMWRLTSQHLSRMKYIDDSLNEAFLTFQGRQESAAKFVNQKREHLLNRANLIRTDLRRLKYLSITPFFCAIFLLFIKHPDFSMKFQYYFHSVYTSIACFFS